MSRRAVAPFTTCSRRSAYATRDMKMLYAFLALAAATSVPADASDTRRADAAAAFEARRAGRILPLREIERRVLPSMPGWRYIGFDFTDDGSRSIYTLKFLRDGNVVWVEADGRTGEILGRSN